MIWRRQVSSCCETVLQNLGGGVFDAFLLFERLSNLTSRETPRSIFPRYETWGYLKNHLTIHISLCDETAKAAAIQELEDFKPDFSLAKPFQDVSWNLAFDALHALVTILMKVSILNLLEKANVNDHTSIDRLSHTMMGRTHPPQVSLILSIRIGHMMSHLRALCPLTAIRSATKHP